MKKIGKHRLAVGDLNKFPIKTLVGANEVDVLYVDPPWGDGNYKFWQTMNHKNNGAPKEPVPLETFITNLLRVIHYAVKPGAPIFFEHGLRWKEQVEGLIKAQGFVYTGCLERLYRAGSSKLPMNMHIFCKGGKYNYPVAKVQKTLNEKQLVSEAALDYILKPACKAGGILMDPCTGLGYGAKLAFATGMTFYGLELNAKRMQQTEKWLTRKMSRHESVSKG